MTTAIRSILLTRCLYYVDMAVAFGLLVLWTQTGWTWALCGTCVLTALYMAAMVWWTGYVIQSVRELRDSRRPKRHPLTQGCMPIHCHSCNLDEPGRRDAYIACGECGHVYRTAGALRRQWRRVEWEWMRNPNADTTWFRSDWSAGRFRTAWAIATVRMANIYSCPYCSHDF